MKSGWSDRLRDSRSLVKMAAAEEVEAVRVAQAGNMTKDKGDERERERGKGGRNEEKERRGRKERNWRKKRKKQDRADKTGGVVWRRWDLN